MHTSVTCVRRSCAPGTLTRTSAFTIDIVTVTILAVDVVDVNVQLVVEVIYEAFV